MFQLLSFGQANKSVGSTYQETLYDPIDCTSYPATPITYPSESEWSTWSKLCVLSVIIFVAFNTKSFPFMWHLRILNGFRFVLRTQRSAVPLSPSQIFQPLITSSTAPLLEIDFNLHKSNSTYFADIDVSRAHLACTLFSRGIEHMRGGTAAYTGSGRKQFGLALGAVSCSFRKEVAPYQNYEMWSKILAWDEKWVYIVTHFVRAGSAAPKSCTLYPQQSGGQRPAGHKIDSATFDSLTSDDKASTDKCLFATALSKCVFKYGRETVAPQKMFKLSGLITPDMSEPVLEQIEAQRVQGLKAASALATENQKALEAEFGGMSTDALGRHSDGSGVMGVVGTLLQLAKLKKSQVL